MSDSTIKQLGVTHCDTCGEYRLLGDDGECVFCRRHYAAQNMSAAQRCVDGLRAHVVGILGYVHPNDLRAAVEEALKGAPETETIDELDAVLVDAHERGIH